MSCDDTREEKASLFFTTGPGRRRGPSGEVVSPYDRGRRCDDTREEGAAALFTTEVREEERPKWRCRTPV